MQSSHHVSAQTRELICASRKLVAYCQEMYYRTQNFNKDQVQSGYAKHVYPYAYEQQELNEKYASSNLLAQILRSVTRARITRRHIMPCPI